MAYVGNNLTIQQYSPQVAYFNGTGSATAFTLPVAVVSAAQIIVAIENVIQNPSSAFTVSGTTLTFTSAPPSGTSNIWVEYTSLQTNIIQPAAGTVGQTQMASPTGTGNPVLQTSPTLVTPTISTGAGSASFPSATGTVMVSGNMPAFRAYMANAQTIAGSTFVKLQFNTEVFDTNNCYDPTTNYRFTPTVAGYYQIQSNIYSTSTSQLYIYKNGAIDTTGLYVNAIGQAISGLLSLNGTTDYVEIYIYAGSGFTTANNAAGSTQFSGYLVRTT
jgi:hypothetical protein